MRNQEHRDIHQDEKTCESASGKRKGLIVVLILCLVLAIGAAALIPLYRNYQKTVRETYLDRVASSWGLTLPAKKTMIQQYADDDNWDGGDLLAFTFRPGSPVKGTILDPSRLTQGISQADLDDLSDLSDMMSNAGTKPAFTIPSTPEKARNLSLRKVKGKKATLYILFDRSRQTYSLIEAKG